LVPAPAFVPPEASAAERIAPASTSRLGRLVTVGRLVHPFPSLLDGIVVAIVALVAGGAPLRAALLGVSTTCLQFAIGTLNDLVDAPRDAETRTGKPIADGLVSEPAAKAVLVSFGGAGLALALIAGPLLLVIAFVGLVIGVWYDLRAKGTRLSWLPIALGLPLLPVYGWYGATGSLPPAFTVLVPAAVLAGAALAIANAAVDIERDVSAGATSLAVALGPTRSTALALLLQVLVAAIAIASCSRSHPSGPWLGATLATAMIPIAGALLGFLLAGRRPASREVAFEVQAVGLGLLAVAWVNALSAAAA
jgi:4-hydroxybenzoate polyprenyltransferase